MAGLSRPVTAQINQALQLVISILDERAAAPVARFLFDCRPADPHPFATAPGN